MKILFVAFEFAPLNAGGVYRSVAFSKQLPEFGIEPIVVTLDDNSYGQLYETFQVDETLLNELENTVVEKVALSKVVKKKNRFEQFSSIYFSIYGNETNYWKGNFKKKIDELFKAHQFEAVLFTLPPFSLLPLAYWIKEKYRLPLVLDFRDAWSQWRTSPYGSYLHYLVTLRQEYKMLKLADAIITTSKQTEADFMRLHTSIDEKKFHYISNGYEGSRAHFNPVNPTKDSWTIGYVGSFYYSPQARQNMMKSWYKRKAHRMLQYIPKKQDWLYRSPYFFFRLLKDLKHSNFGLYSKINVKFAGASPDWLVQMISDFGLDDKIELLGRISHNESLSFQESCDLLLITSAKQMKGKDYSIAGKTFEYIKAGKPIIALVCEGAQKDLLLESGTAICLDPDADNNCIKISDFFKKPDILKPNVSFLESLSRISKTESLSNLLWKLCQD